MNVKDQVQHSDDGFTIRIHSLWRKLSTFDLILSDSRTTTVTHELNVTQNRNYVCKKMKTDK